MRSKTAGISGDITLQLLIKKSVFHELSARYTLGKDSVWPGLDYMTDPVQSLGSGLCLPTFYEGRAICSLWSGK